METKNELRAQALLKRLKRDPHVKIERPFFIEITGSPDSGKTTMIEILDSFFRRQDFRVFCPQEGAQRIRHVPRTSHLYNVRTAIYALTELIDCSTNSNFDLVIFDRCLCDGYTWMIYWNQQKDLTDEQAKTIQDFFLFPTWLNMIDARFFVIASPEEALRRDQAESLTKKFGKTTNPASLKNRVEINISAHEQIKKFTRLPNNIFLVDTTNLGITEMTEVVLENTLNALENRFQ